MAPHLVQLGSVVTVFSEEEMGEQTFRIVEPEEADILDGRLSADGPLGEALFGRQEGDEVTVRLPNGNWAVYEVTHVQLAL